MSNIDIDEIFGGPASKTAEQVESENKNLEKALAEEGRKSRMNPDILAKLKAKAGKEEEAPVPKVISKKEVSINIGVLGVGQAGSRIAEVFHKKGYDVGVINTSSQDLKFIDVLPHQKLLLEGSLGGTGKDLDLGRDIFEASQEQVLDFTERVLDGNDMAFLAVSGGGGCTTEDTMIINSDVGTETIKSFYTRMKKDSKEFVRSDGQRFLDISNKDILSYSLRKDGTIFKNKINQIWFNGRKNDYISVKTNNGVYQVTPSHPFFIFENGKIVEREAQYIKNGDLLINSGNKSEDWFFNNEIEVEYLNKKIRVGKDFAYALGVIAGDGHLHKSGKSVDITTQLEVLEKVNQTILEKFSIKKQNYIVYKNNAQTWRWNGRDFAEFIKNSLDLDDFGAKSDKICVPSIIKRSGKDIIGAFFAGLLDADGFVYKNKAQLKFSSISKNISKEVSSILSLFGANTTLSKYEPHGKAKHPIYDVRVSGSSNMKFIFDYVLPNMACHHKVKRLLKFKSRKQRSFSKSVVQIPKESLIKDFGLTLDFRAKRHKASNARYGANSHFLSRPFFERMLNDNSYHGILRGIYDKIEPVVNIERRNNLVEFYDLSMDNDCHNYLAGKGGLTFIHNTGSSSVDVMVDTLFATEMPVGVIYVLPKATEDAQSKRNSIETLARLARMAADNMIDSLVVVDNARIETIYGGLSQAKFWDTANEAIVDPIHLFNSLTAQPSRHTSLDPSDFGKIISAGDCSVYGVVEVENYMEETALAEAIIESLSGNMLAEGFDLEQTRVGGVMILGSDEAISELPAINIDYCFHMISEKTNGASIYQGIYVDETAGKGIKIYSWFAGLGLPQDRIENLQKESKEQAAVLAEKERARASSMTLDLEEDKATSVADKIHKKISKKKSGFNKLQGGARKSIIDRRRR